MSMSTWLGEWNETYLTNIYSWLETTAAQKQDRLDDTVVVEGQWVAQIHPTASLLLRSTSLRRNHSASSQLISADLESHYTAPSHDLETFIDGKKQFQSSFPYQLHSSPWNRFHHSRRKKEIFIFSPEHARISSLKDGRFVVKTEPPRNTLERLRKYCNSDRIKEGFD